MRENVRVLIGRPKRKILVLKTDVYFALACFENADRYFYFSVLFRLLSPDLIAIYSTWRLLRNLKVRFGGNSVEFMRKMCKIFFRCVSSMFLEKLDFGWFLGVIDGRVWIFMLLLKKIWILKNRKNIFLRVVRWCRLFVSKFLRTSEDTSNVIKHTLSRVLYIFFLIFHILKIFSEVFLYEKIAKYLLEMSRNVGRSPKLALCCRSVCAYVSVNFPNQYFLT